MEIIVSTLMVLVFLSPKESYCSWYLVNLSSNRSGLHQDLLERLGFKSGPEKKIPGTWEMKDKEANIYRLTFSSDFIFYLRQLDNPVIQINGDQQGFFFREADGIDRGRSG